MNSFLEFRIDIETCNKECGHRVDPVDLITIDSRWFCFGASISIVLLLETKVSQS